MASRPEAWPCNLQWEALDDREKDRFGYERQLKRFMDGMMDDLRRKIQRNEQRLAQNEIPVLVSSEQVGPPCSTAARAQPRCQDLCCCSWPRPGPSVSCKSV